MTNQTMTPSQGETTHEQNTLPWISFTTCCKGRLHQLEQTMPQNLEWNRSYPNLEFVLLDYNSQDGLEEWVKQHMQQHIASGRLKYFKFPTPEYYSFSHAKNLAMRLAEGEIICNLDADNFTADRFAFYLAEQLEHVDFLVGCSTDNGTFDSDGDQGVTGRFAIRKSLFNHMGGYDERMDSWGFEDHDLFHRLQLLNCSSKTIDSKYLKCITHGDEERNAFTRFKNIGRTSRESGGSCYINKTLSMQRLSKGVTTVNEGDFGCGDVYKNFDPETISAPLYRQQKISFCIVCDGSFHHLRNTLPLNLEHNAQHPGVEFVLLGLDADDGLEAWLENDMKAHLASGRLVFHRTTAPGVSNAGGAIQTAFDLASGDILCSLNPEDYTGPELAEYINHVFVLYGKTFMSTGQTGNNICVTKQDFLSLNGQDKLTTDGRCETTDLCRRLEGRGLRMKHIPPGRIQPHASRGALEKRTAKPERPSGDHVDSQMEPYQERLTDSVNQNGFGIGCVGEDVTSRTLVTLRLPKTRETAFKANGGMPVEPTKRFVLEPTLECNARCKFCYHLHRVEEWKHTRQTFERVKQAIDEGLARGNDYMDITGGEPTMYPHICETIDYALSNGIRTNVITHGMVGHNRTAKILDSGIDDWLVSVHNLKEKQDTITVVKGSHKKQVRFIEQIAKQMTFRVNCVINRDNQEDLVDVARFVSQYPVRIVNFINFNPHHEWKEEDTASSKLVADLNIVEPLLNEAIGVLEANRIGVNVRYYPMCRISESYRRCVCNYSQLTFDPYEWDHYIRPKTREAHLEWNKNCSLDYEEKGAPCSQCDLQNICGGINKHFRRVAEQTIGEPCVAQTIEGLSDADKNDVYYYRKHNSMTLHHR